MKILVTFGTRPEAYKMIPLVLALGREDGIQTKVCVTAQHRGLLDQALEPFGIKADYDFDIMTVGQTLTDITTKVLFGLPAVIEEFNPDIMLVHGDTTTTFAASLAAFYGRVRVGHVEAGLRTFNKYSPYPEEMNRKLTTALTDLFFAPTEVSRGNLLKENVPDGSIFVTGNTAIDLIKYTTKEKYRFKTKILNSLDFSKQIILMTAHRGENRGQPMENICRAALRIVDAFPDVLLVWPLHPGKAVTEPANAILGRHERIMLTEAVDVFDMHNLMSRSHLLLTDSGGLQEEAPSFDLPVIVLREVTERPEGKDAGTLVLAGVDEGSIYDSAINLMTDKNLYDTMAATKNPYGDGNASQRIVEVIKAYAS